MATSNSRKIILAIFVLLAVSLQCNLPERFVPEGVPMSENERQQLTDNYAGTYQIRGYGDYNDPYDPYDPSDPCYPEKGFYQPEGSPQTIAIQGNKLIITNENGVRTYPRQSDKYENVERFCRKLESGKLECISAFQPGPPIEYLLDIVDGSRECFTASVLLDTLVQVPIVENPPNEEAEAATNQDDGEQVGEGGQGNTEPDQGSEAEEPPVPEPEATDHVIETLPAEECNAIDDLTYELVITRDTEDAGKNERHLSYSVVFNDISGDVAGITLRLYTHSQQFEANSYRWVGGYGKLVDMKVDFYYRRAEDGENYYLLEKIVAFKGDPLCTYLIFTEEELEKITIDFEGPIQPLE